MIVAYNAIILNNLYAKSLKAGQKASDLEELLRISPMSWMHIAFTGRYTFKNGNKKIDLKEMINILTKELRARKKKAYKKKSN